MVYICFYENVCVLLFGSPVVCCGEGCGELVVGVSVPVGIATLLAALSCDRRDCWVGLWGARARPTSK